MIVFEEIEEKLKNEFKLNSLLTLNGLINKQRLELGKDYKDELRFDYAYKKSFSLVEKYFVNKQLWIRIIFWDVTNNSLLDQFFFNGKLKDIKHSKKIEDESLIYYLCLDDFDKKLVGKLVKSSVGYELGYDDTFNITCFYFNIEHKILLNIYDDRGIDVISSSSIGI